MLNYVSWIIVILSLKSLYVKARVGKLRIIHSRACYTHGYRTSLVCFERSCLRCCFHIGLVSRWTSGALHHCLLHLGSSRHAHYPLETSWLGCHFLHIVHMAMVLVHRLFCNLFLQYIYVTCIIRIQYDMIYYVITMIQVVCNI